jgi:hypothetical protein
VSNDQSDLSSEHVLELNSPTLNPFSKTPGSLPPFQYNNNNPRISSVMLLIDIIPVRQRALRIIAVASFLGLLAQLVP